MSAVHSATGSFCSVAGSASAAANRRRISPTIVGRSHEAIVVRSLAVVAPVVRWANRQRFCWKKPQVQFAWIAWSTACVSGGAFSIAAANCTSRSGSSGGRSPVAVSTRVAIARAASAHALSFTAACSTPASTSPAVFGFPSSIAFSTCCQIAARGPAGVSSPRAARYPMPMPPRTTTIPASAAGPHHEEHLDPERIAPVLRSDDCHEPPSLCGRPFPVP